MINDLLTRQDARESTIVAIGKKYETQINEINDSIKALAADGLGRLEVVIYPHDEDEANEYNKVYIAECHRLALSLEYYYQEMKFKAQAIITGDPISHISLKLEW